MGALINIIFFLYFCEKTNHQLLVGGLFEEYDGDDEMAFNLALEVINEDNDSLGYNLEPITRVASGFNSVSVSRAICSITQNGIVALIGPKSSHTLPYVKSLCDVKDIPLLQTNWDVAQQPNSYLVNLHPHPSVLAASYVDIIKAWGWKSFTIFYENNESLYRVTELVKMYSFAEYTVTLRQMSPDRNYRNTWLEIKRTGERHYAIDCSTVILHDVLQQAQQVGIMSEGYHYLILNLDMYTMDLFSYQHGGANITGVRIVSLENPTVQIAAEKLYNLKVKKHLISKVDNETEIPKLETSTALVVDALYLLHETLKELYISSKKRPHPLLCNRTDSWEKGSSIINYMKATTLTGLTGEINFDIETGVRKDFVLDIIELSLLGLTKVGTWSSKNGLVTSRQHTEDAPFVDEEHIMRNKMFKVVTTLTQPYGMLKNVSYTLEGNQRFEGFGIELFEELSKMLGFNYTFVIQEDGANGNYNPKTRKWDGMLGEIVAKRVDFAIADLTISSERERDVDFTMPFMSLGISILYKKPEPAPPSLFSFASPFSSEVWVLIGATYLVVSCTFFIVGRLSPSEWTNPFPCIEEPEFLKNQYTFKNALWFTIGCLMQQGSEVAPIAISTRLASGVWWFFTLVMVSSYTANLAAFLTVEELVTPFNDVNQLVAQTEISYGAKHNGATHNFFKNSNYSVYPQIRDYMSQHPEEMTNDNEEGVDRVENENYAFFMESTTIEYMTERHCDLKQVGGALDEKGYGIAMQKDSQYRFILSMAILELQETGVIEQIKRKWWKEKRGGGTCEKRQPAATPLDLKNLGGVFFVLIVGTIFGVFATVVELALHTYRKSHKRQLSFKNEVKKEIKFFLKFREKVKDIEQRDKSVGIVDNDNPTENLSLS